jgi:hypothetical protein
MGPKQGENTTNTAFLAPEQGAEKCANEFFNTLTSYRHSSE